MIVRVDLLAGVPVVCLDQSSDDGAISVVVSGARERTELDQALTEACAGCVPSHHAELRVEWVRSQPGYQEYGHHSAQPGWLLHADEEQQWVAARIFWETEAAITAPASPGAA